MTKKTETNSVYRHGHGRPTPKSAETRSRIIEGALHTVENEGIEAVRTRKIAEMAGVNLATLHYHFESKEALLLAVLDSLIEEMVGQFRSKIDENASDEDRVENLIRTIWAVVERSREKQIAQIELTLYALRTQGSEWIAARQYNAFLSAYKSVLIRNKKLSDDDAERIGLAISRFVLMGVDGLILQAFALGDQKATRVTVEAFIIAAKDYVNRLSLDIGAPR